MHCALRELNILRAIDRHIWPNENKYTNSSSKYFFLRGNTPCPYYYQSAFYTFSSSNHGREENRTPTNVHMLLKMNANAIANACTLSLRQIVTNYVGNS